MPRKRSSRTYWRERGGARRAYADFRDYADVGGGREALIVPGETSATTDSDVASKLATDRVLHLEELRRGKALLGVNYRATLSEYAAHYLKERKRAGKVTDKWLERSEMHLRSALSVLDPDNRRDLTVLTPRDVRKWLEYLETVDNGRGGTLSASTRRKWLFTLSGLFRYAASEGYVAPGHNPVAALIDKPSDVPQEARWLEVSDAALYLEAARLYEPPARHPNLSEPIPWGYPLGATFLLTGGRRAEVLGIRRRDVSFDRRTVTFRRHEARPRLKTRNADRVVPLWPQLETILREHVFGGPGPDLHADRAIENSDALLFPGETGAMITDTRKLLEAIGERAGWTRDAVPFANGETGPMRTKVFRHTYCSARLQTVDRGMPVSPFTVACELGHGGESLVRKVYGHLGQIRHRSEHVEYRVEQHEEVLGERLAALRAS